MSTFIFQMIISHHTFLFLPFERTTVTIIKQDVLVVAICYVVKPAF